MLPNYPPSPPRAGFLISGATLRLILATLLLASLPAFAQTPLTAPLIGVCSSATEGQSTQPWPASCTAGMRFAPLTDGGMVATGDFSTQCSAVPCVYRDFASLPDDIRVAYCPIGAVYTDATRRCRTADDSAFATNFTAKGNLIAAADTFRLEVRWSPVLNWLVRKPDGTWVAGDPIAEPITYAVDWYPVSAPGLTTTVRTAGPPAVFQVPKSEICVKLRAIVGNYISDDTEPRCIAPLVRKPGTPGEIDLVCAQDDSTVTCTLFMPLKP